MTASSKRAEYVAWTSLVVSVVFFGVALFLGRWSGFFAVSAISWQILASALIWLVLAIQFHQRALAEQERLDTSQLAKDETAANIFQAKGERVTLFAVAQRRLEILERWFMPMFSALIASYEAGIGLYLLKIMPTGTDGQTQQPLVCAIGMTAVAFVSFLMSRYATGMSAQPQWKPLRAGGSFLLGVAVLCFVLAVCLALTHFQIFKLVIVINFAVPLLMVVLGSETALNVVLDIYRPRLKGQYSRAAFDSRLLGIINEPGGIFRSAAGAIDYQFGFKVSQTWFYKLLEKAIVPLVLFSAVTLHLASCIVVVGPDEEAIIEHFGNPHNRAGQVRQIGPGLWLKWPWPIDAAYKYPTKTVQELNIGFVPKIDPSTKKPVREALLWGRTHYEREYNVLVASRQSGVGLAEGAVPVSLVKANIPVHYRIKDLYAYIYKHSKPERLLEAICYRMLTEFAAGATVEVADAAGSEGDLSGSLFGAGRERAKGLLSTRIQQSADAEGLGIEVVFVGVQGIHPPPEVAADYEGVVGAIQKKQAIILDAHAERNKTLSMLIGSVGQADALYNHAAQYQRAEQENRREDMDKLGQELDGAFAQAKGEIFATLRDAQGYAFEKATLARATGERFAGQVKAYRAAKEIYKREQRLVVLEEALKDVRKFIVAADANDFQVFIVDLQEKLTPSLYDIGGIKESSGK
jgi:regulator of protease activity HflC (stomatin/prohibitin superfamily)